MVPWTRKQGIKKFKSFQQIIRCRGCTLDSYMNTVIQLGFWTAILVLSLELYVMVLQLKVSRLLKLTRLILVDLLVKITLQMLMLNFCWVSVGLANFCLLCLIVVTPTWNCHSTLVLERKTGYWIEFVFVTFADLDRYPDLRCHRLVKA